MESHFWLGEFDSKEAQRKYFEETNFENEALPISKFAEDQNIDFYDHDFLEFGFEENIKSISYIFKDYSYSNLSLPKLEELYINKNLANINSIIFINSNEIETPQSSTGKGYSIEFIGTIEY